MAALRYTIPLVLLCTHFAFAAEPPKDNFGDPLPAEAKARIGTALLNKRAGGAEWMGATLTPDGKFLLSPVPDGAIEKLDVTTGRAVGTIGEKVPGRSGREVIQLSADGKRGLSLGDTSVTVWDAATGRVLSSATTRVDWTLPGSLASAALSANGSTFAFGINDQPKAGTKLTVVVWTVGEAKRRLDVEVEQDRYVSVGLSPDGKTLATWGQDFARGAPMIVPDTPVQFWDATSGKKLGKFTLKEAALAGVTFTPDGKSVAIIDGKGGVLLIDPATGRETRRLAVRGEAGGTVVFSPDGKRFAVGWGDGTIRVWDVTADKELSATKSPARVGGSGAHVAFVDEKRLVAWGIEGSKAVVWEVPSGKLLSPRGGPTETVGTITFTPDGKELLTNASEWSVPRWDPLTGKSLGVRTLEVPVGINLPDYRAARPLPGGTKILAHAGIVQYVYDARTGKRLHDLTNGGRVSPPQLCADGELTLTAVGVEPGERADPSKPLKFVVKELATDKKLCEIELPGPTLQNATRTTDGKRLLTNVYVPLPNECRTFHALTLWELATGKKLGQIELPTAPWLTPPAGPGGTHAFVTHRTGEPREYDLITGKVLREINVKGLTVCAGPVLSPNGKLLAVGLTDYENLTTTGVFDVCVIDAETGKPLKSFRGHKGLVSALAFSPDGKTLASGSADTTVLLWDLTTIPAPK